MVTSLHHPLFGEQAESTVCSLPYATRGQNPMTGSSPHEAMSRELAPSHGTGAGGDGTITAAAPSTVKRT